MAGIIDLELERSEISNNLDEEKHFRDRKTENRSKRRKRKNNVIKEYLIDYTTNSNLHGLRYIGEKERTSIEKIFWIFVCICCVVLCSDLIKKLWDKWNDSPVIVTLSENPTPVWRIPYPAVTVCFETKAKQTVFNFTDYYHRYYNDDTFDNLTISERKNIFSVLWIDTDVVIVRRNKFEDMCMVCDDHLAPEGGRNFSSGSEILETISEVSPDMTDVFRGCKFYDVAMDNCSELFRPILTEEGKCYTFNILGAQDMFREENLHQDYTYLETRKENTGWSLDKGYENESSEQNYPHRGLGFGTKAGITFLLKVNEEDLDYLCKGPVQGFKILLHNPAELPRLSQQYFRAPLSQEVVVALKPKIMTTADSLRAYDATRRKCYFQDERYLEYFKVYTQANCEMECLTNFTYARCGCVHFGVPHGPNMRTCNAGKMACLKKAQMELVSAKAQIPLKSDDPSLTAAVKVAKNCKCEPACTSIEYETETSQANYNVMEVYKAYRVPPDNFTYTRVMIFFKEAQFVTSRRSELYGQIDFLANCGGLLGLFMGFSILSIVEVLYFFTLRIFCVWWRHGQQKAQESVVDVKK